MWSVTSGNFDEFGSIRWLAGASEPSVPSMNVLHGGTLKSSIELESSLIWGQSSVNRRIGAEPLWIIFVPRKGLHGGVAVRWERSAWEDKRRESCDDQYRPASETKSMYLRWWRNNAYFYACGSLWRISKRVLEATMNNQNPHDFARLLLIEPLQPFDDRTCAAT